MSRARNYLSSLILTLLVVMPALASDRISAPVSSDSWPEFNYSTSLMTTTVDFRILLTSSRQSEEIAGKAVKDAISEIERITQVLSEWEPDSEISAINRAAGQAPVNVSDEVFRLIAEAVRLSELSRGKFDITFKSAGQLWDFRARTIPEEGALQRAVKAINYRNVVLDNNHKTVFLKESNTRIGLGGIAKGYAIDRAVQIIRAAGFELFYINAGGDLYASSGIRDKRWKVGIQDPDNSDDLVALLPVANAAVATSGDYERFFEKDGIRYHHIIDPATGEPARLSRSVTVLTSRAYLADALATAVFVLGPDDGLALIRSLPEAEALIIDSTGAIQGTMLTIQ